MCLIFGFLTNLFTELTVHAYSYSMFTGYEATCVPILIPNQCCDIISHFDHMLLESGVAKKTKNSRHHVGVLMLLLLCKRASMGKAPYKACQREGWALVFECFRILNSACTKNKQTNKQKKQKQKKKQVGCFNHRVITLVAIMLKSMSGLFGI